MFNPDGLQTVNGGEQKHEQSFRPGELFPRSTVLRAVDASSWDLLTDLTATFWAQPAAWGVCGAPVKPGGSSPGGDQRLGAAGEAGTQSCLQTLTHLVTPALKG